MMAFIDGENLVFTYQRLLETMSKASLEVTHRPDVFVWHKDSIEPSKHEILRATYYTSAVGDPDTQLAIVTQIKNQPHAIYNASFLPHSLTPYVIKKEKQSKKTKRVDVKLSVDLLTNCYNNNLDTVYLITGDADYLPVIKAARHLGKQVFLAFFETESLSPKLLQYVDDFIPLNAVYFPEK